MFSEAEKKTSKKTSKKKNKKKNKKKKNKKKNKMMIVSAGGADENKAERRCLMNVARTHALSLPLCLRALFFSFFFSVLLFPGAFFPPFVCSCAMFSKHIFKNIDILHEFHISIYKLYI